MENSVANIQTRSAVLRNDSINVEERTAEFVISSEAVDTYNTVFLAAGASLERYKKNNVFTYNHFDWSPDEDVVLGVSEVRKEGKQIIAKAYFEPKEINKKADKIFRKVQAGTLKGASIRATVHEGRYGDFDAGENPDVFYFTRWELLAWSIVTVNSNPDAVKRNQEGLQSILDENKPEPQTDPENTQDDTAERNAKMWPHEAQNLINQNRKR